MSGHESTASALDSPCDSCMKNLVSALKSATTKTQTLLKSIGVDISDEFFQISGNSVVVDVPLMYSTDLSTKNENPESVGFGGVRFDNVLQANAITTSDEMFTESERPNRERFPISNMNSKDSNSTNIMENDISTISKSLKSLEIICQKCSNTGPEGGARAFVKGPHPLSIVLCSNRLFSKEDIEQVLIHELVHVFDIYVRKWDLTNCQTLAKSEVRAARLAECANSSMNITNRYCSKDKARVATTNMFPDIGMKCVADVFDSAMEDYLPFGSQEEMNNGNPIFDAYRESEAIFGRKVYSSQKGS